MGGVRLLGCRRTMTTGNNLGGTKRCGVDCCLNNYTPNKTEDGELRCITHAPDRYDG